MNRRAVPLVLAVAAVAVGGAAIAYQLTRDSLEPTGNVGALPSPSLATAPAVDPARLRVAELMADAGCVGKVIGTQMFSYETGRCDLNGGEVTIAVFDSEARRDQWVDAASAYGGTFVRGERWAAMCETPDAADELAGKLGGRRV